MWRDDELPAHRAYSDVIAERLKAAKAVVVIWSAEADGRTGIDGAAGDHVWAERWDRDLTDIFAVQHEISEAIVAALKLKPLPEEKKAIERRNASSRRPRSIRFFAFTACGSARSRSSPSARSAAVRPSSRLTPVVAQRRLGIGRERPGAGIGRIDVHRARNSNSPSGSIRTRWRRT
ncbi:MAG: hypothetical protein ACYC8V_00815 [Caulobacteraceae bacterium]